MPFSFDGLLIFGIFLNFKFSVLSFLCFMLYHLPLFHVSLSRSLNQSPLLKT